MKSGTIRQLEELESRWEARQALTNFQPYRLDPVSYAAKVLGVSWWSKQQEIARALVTPPYRVLVKASHSVGKSHVAAGLVNWWYDTHNPGVALTTAPTARQVRDVLWKEVRVQRRGRSGFPGPKIPRLESAPDHFASGFTATSAEAFQGQHGPAVLLILDEAVGVATPIWEACDSMMMGVQYAFLAICNPTDPSSEFYAREQSGKYTVIHINALEHPNIDAELAGLPAPYPSAVRLAWLEDRLQEWSSPVIGEPRPTDIQWPPGGTICKCKGGNDVYGAMDGPSDRDLAPIGGFQNKEGSDYQASGDFGQRESIGNSFLGQTAKEACTDCGGKGIVRTFLRPGPLAEARLLGRWPSATYGVWSDSLWLVAETTASHFPSREVGGPIPLPEIGCDVARFGDDMTAIHARWGNTSVHHETANGWSTSETAGRLKQLARELADDVNEVLQTGSRPIRPEEIPIKVDDDGVGGGVVDQAEGYNFIPVSAGSTAYRDADYPNRRSELWFDVADRCRDGQLSVMALDATVRNKLRLQAMAPHWKLDAAGRRAVEPKDKTKKKLGHSPDDMDAMNLAYCEMSGGTVAEWVSPEQPSHQTEGHRRGTFGRAA